MNRIKTFIGEAPNKHFCNATITWEIRHFSLMTYPQKLLSSPQLKLHGPVETRWKMYLDISRRRNRVLLKLELLSKIAPIKQVKVNWECYLMDEKEKVTCGLRSRSHSFEHKCRLTMEMYSLEDVLETLNRKLSDNLVIKCRMLLDFGLEGKYSNPRVDGVLSLSRDLSPLPTNFLYHDITTTVQNVDFSLHKAMLYQRGEKLAQLIEQSTSDMKVNFNLSNRRAAASLFLYLYTGDLRYILVFPTIAMPDYIDRLGILELENIYPHEIIKMTSNVSVTQHKFSWMIIDFKNVNKTLVSPEFHEDGMEARFQLSMKLKESNGDKSKISLFVEATLVQSEKVLAVYLEFACGKEENKIIDTKSVHGFIAVGDRLGVTLLDSDVSETEECFLSETIFLTFRVCIRNGDVSTEIREIEASPPKDITNEKSLMNLSKILGNILKTHDYSDFHFVVDDSEYKAHKFLVAARSSLLKELFRRHHNLVSVKVSSCSKEIFSTFLSFLYIGIITETDALKLMELYELGDMYNVCSLIDVCANLLPRLINEDNMLKVLAFADDKDEIELKNTAFRYVCERANTLEDHPHLYYFQCKKPEMYALIKSS